MIQILIVEDEESIRDFLKETLERAGYTTTIAKSGEEAMENIREKYFDLALLDLNLGGRVNGLRVLETIRWRWPATACVILTGQGSLQSAIDAIHEGVDLYLLKPIDTDQLRQAIREALEKHFKMAKPEDITGKDPVLRAGPVSINRKTMSVLINDKQINLTRREFTLLNFMMENKDRVVKPGELSMLIGEFEPDNEYEARQYIKWYIHELRKKIEPDLEHPSIVINIRGSGYRFNTTDEND